MKHILFFASMSLLCMQLQGMHYLFGKKKQTPHQQLQTDQKTLLPKNDEFFIPDNQKSCKKISQKKKVESQS